MPFKYVGLFFPKVFLSLFFFSPSHLHKKKLKYSGRSENILKRDIPDLPFGYQIIEIIALKEWEFPQESYARRRDRMKHGVSQRRNLSPRKRFHTVLTTCQTSYRRERNTDKGGLAITLSRTA